MSIVIPADLLHVRTPCPYPPRLSGCALFPQKPWADPMPPPLIMGEWRHEDPTRPAFQREGPSFCHVRRQRGTGFLDYPVFEIDLYNAQVLMVASHIWGARKILECWPEALPGKPEKPVPPAPRPCPLDMDAALDVLADRALREDHDVIGQALTVASGAQAVGITGPELEERIQERERPPRRPASVVRGLFGAAVVLSALGGMIERPPRR